ncbi:gliding motility-associated C-terminal domain-containing protein [Pedobacter suwonensis]|uniref:gliding motility-associated C-terminal domain-containing protein n=1 Tax=Pedobacter suwonensis TaxID=332999 RepID=UPI0036D11AF0
MYPLIKALSFLYIVIFANFVRAQVCTGTFGQPLINQTFGQGNNADNWYGPLAQYAPGATTFTIFKGPPGQNPRALAPNQSGLVKTPSTPDNPYPIYWQHHTDHTGDSNGLMLLIDGISTPTVFFEQKMDNLCPNTILRLSIWVLNTNSPAANAPPPKIILKVIDPNGNFLGNTSTGNVTADGMWHQYTLDFSNGNNSIVTLQLVNDTSTDSGNDFALDDITVRACGPRITPFFNLDNTSLNMCEGNTKSFIVNADILPGYINPVYQWQENKGTGWVDIVGATTKQATINFLNQPKGTYLYRLITAINGNIDKVNCRAVSDPITVTVTPLPVAEANNSGPFCVGNNIQLQASGGTSYNWRGPNGYHSTAQNPTISNATKAMEGEYIVTVTTNGCSLNALTHVQVNDPISISTNVQEISICEGKSVQLSASGGTAYLWSPANSLSDRKSANPIATPTETTTYTVTVSQGACSETAQITVKVNKNATTDAGAGQEIVSGQKITLNGKVSGDVTYTWTPASYLDDPTKLNPIATPPRNITYTSQATSKLGCSSSSDEVNITVYPQVVIPNTFSPNGDNVNDTWNIPAAALFPNPKIKITNRYGNVVYQSTGPFKPWDGKMNGKDLPPAVYYYSVYLNEKFETYTGWLMLVR